MTGLTIFRFHDDGLVSLFTSVIANLWHKLCNTSCHDNRATQIFQVNTHICYCHYTSTGSGEVRIINIITPRITWTFNSKGCGKPLVVVFNFIQKSQCLRSLCSGFTIVDLTSYINLIYIVMNWSFTEYGLIWNELVATSQQINR